jgi:hypothetical protein
MDENGLAVLDLNSMDGLNDEVVRQIAALSSCLRDGQDKASLTVTISLKLAPSSSSMVEVSWKTKPTYPSKSCLMLAHADSVGNLLIYSTPAQRELFPPQLEVVKNG